MTNFYILLILMLPAFWGMSASAGTQSNCASFCSKPDLMNFKACKDQIDKMKLRSYKRKYLDIVDTEQLFRQLISIINANNPYAIRLGVQIIPFTEGASAEDLEIALGKTIDKDPKAILDAFKSNSTGEEAMRRILLNLGDTYVDKLDSMLIEVEKRKKIIEGVNNKELILIKNKCLKILNKRGEKLRHLQGETHKQ